VLRAPCRTAAHLAAALQSAAKILENSTNNAQGEATAEKIRNVKMLHKVKMITSFSNIYIYSSIKKKAHAPTAARYVQSRHCPAPLLRCVSGTVHHQSQTMAFTAVLIHRRVQLSNSI
jgi:hypothetical protein